MSKTIKNSRISEGDWITLLGLTMFKFTSCYKDEEEASGCIKALKDILSVDDVESMLEPEILLEIFNILFVAKKESHLMEDTLELYNYVVPAIGYQYFSENEELSSILPMVIRSEYEKDFFTYNQIVTLSNLLSEIPIENDIHEETVCYIIKCLSISKDPEMAQKTVQLLAETIEKYDETFIPKVIATLLEELVHSNNQSLLLAILLSSYGRLASDGEPAYGLHERCFELLANIIIGSNIEAKIMAITLVNQFIEKFSARNTLYSLCISKTTPYIVNSISQRGNTLTNYEVKYFAEAIKFLMLIHSICTNSLAILAIVLPALIKMLNLENEDQVHQTALQVLLRYAQTNAEEFGSIMESQVTMEDKQILQMSVQNNMIREQKAAEEQQKKQKKVGGLSIDASAFG
eukprot:TRINITY_DN12339_c0_g1_i1.p1 TRINITY_DN12339_c0_g1~~TRINITY_DN12339_c0_g1_i1.p1  ORF type:complete len:405 (-),score=76.58 TRINITY_DN12339_c0_g1_i1:66-1280(-)